MFNEKSIKKNIKLANYTTFKIGGNAKYFFIAKNEKDILDILEWAKDKNEKIFILGGGSNILFRDEGFNGVVIKMDINKDIKIKKESEKKVIVNIGAGCKFVNLIEFSREHSLSGTEWASGIPGLTVGGAIRGNAGAFGVSMSDIIKNVEVIKLVQNTKVETEFAEWTKGQPALAGKKCVGRTTGCGQKFCPRQSAPANRQDANKSFEMKTDFIKLSKKECLFKYRSSIFKEKNNYIIISADLELNRGDMKEIEEKIKNYAELRKEKQPLVFRNAGSIFKNVIYTDFTPPHSAIAPVCPASCLPASAGWRRQGAGRQAGGGSRGELGSTSEDELQITEFKKTGVVPAGWLIERCKLKSHKIGGAMISEKHANFIVNLGNAKAKDVIDLMELAEREVKKKFGVKLEREIEVV